MLSQAILLLLERRVKMFGLIVDFLIKPVIGVPIFVWIIIAIILFIFIKVNYFSSGNKVKKDKKKSEPEIKPDKKKTKTKRTWKFNFPSFGGIKGFFKWMSFERFVIFFVTPAVIVIGFWLWYIGMIELSKMNVFWLVVIGLALTIFASRSPGFQFMVGLGLIVFLGYLTYQGIASMNLKGTPDPIKIITVTDLNHFQYYIREPRWTGFDLRIQEDCLVDISASGKVDFDTTDSHGYNGPDGVRNPKGNTVRNNVSYMTPSQVRRPGQFINGLQNEPFACLIGKVGTDGKVFVIGERCQIPMKKGDVLYLGLNYRWMRAGGNKSFRISWKFAKGNFNLKAVVLPASPDVS